MRLFVAVDVSDGLRQHLADQVTPLRAVAPLAKWVAPELYHLTLVFLGSVAEAQLEPVCAAALAVARRHAPIALEARGLGVFGGDRPSVLWLGFEGDVAPLATLQEELQRELAALGHPLEDRPYAPHLTLARARSRGGDPALAWCAGRPMARLGRLDARELTVYDSTTRAEGPRYTPRLRAPLGGDPR